MHRHEEFTIENGVYTSPSAKEKFRDFEENYLKIREKEKRVLDIPEIRQLPFVVATHPDHALWKTRRRNIFRFLNYLSKKKGQLNILDVGCGNGFFSNLMASQGHRVVGLDVNLTELKQAAEAFEHPTLKWVYADIFLDNLPEHKFDLITFCCSFQYFEHPAQLLKRCKELLHPNGELHIIDSPFYPETKIEAAKKRSANYFRSMYTENMERYYHHNTLQIFKDYACVFKYKPSILKVKMLKDSPFPWIMVK